MNEEEKKALIASIKEAINEKTKEADTILRQIQEKVQAGEKVSEGLKDAMAKVTEENQKLHGRINDLEQKLADDAKKGDPRKGQQKSPGEMFVESDALKDFVKRGGKGPLGRLQA